MLGERYKPGEEVDRVGELLQAVLRSSARVPEAVCVAPRRNGRKVTFQVSAAPFDQLRLLDTTGSAVKALRIIVGAMAQSLRMDFALEFAAQDAGIPNGHPQSPAGENDG